MPQSSHCFFVSNCIGERNLRNFVLFLIFSSLNGLHISLWICIDFILSALLMDIGAAIGLALTIQDNPLLFDGLTEHKGLAIAGAVGLIAGLIMLL